MLANFLENHVFFPYIPGRVKLYLGSLTETDGQARFYLLDSTFLKEKERSLRMLKYSFPHFR